MRAPAPAPRRNASVFRGAFCRLRRRSSLITSCGGDISAGSSARPMRAAASWLSVLAAVGCLMLGRLSLGAAVEHGLSDMDAMTDAGAEVAADPCSCADRVGWRSASGRPCTGYRRVDDAQRVWVNRTRCVEDGADFHCRWSCGRCPAAADGCIPETDDDATGAARVHPVMIYIGVPCIGVSFLLAIMKSCCYHMKDKRVRMLLVRLA
jgi:hypothetical protein